MTEHSRSGPGNVPAQPGWFQCPDDPEGTTRFFDGEVWTRHFSPEGRTDLDVPSEDLNGNGLGSGVELPLSPAGPVGGRAAEEIVEDPGDWIDAVAAMARGGSDAGPNGDGDAADQPGSPSASGTAVSGVVGHQAVDPVLAEEALTADAKVSRSMRSRLMKLLSVAVVLAAGLVVFEAYSVWREPEKSVESWCEVINGGSLSTFGNLLERVEKERLRGRPWEIVAELAADSAGMYRRARAAAPYEIREETGVVAEGMTSVAAALANLKIPDDEIDEARKDLAIVAGYIEELNLPEVAGGDEFTSASTKVNIFYFENCA